MPMAKLDVETLKAALVGYQQEYAEIGAKMDEIRRRIKGMSAADAGAVAPATSTRRTMSPAARRRIAAAQRKRWAAYHSEHGKQRKASPRKPAGKRKLSPEGRQRIIDALKRRWAAAKKQSAA